MSDYVTLWTVAHQASLSMGFSRQDYWHGLPFPPPGDLPASGTELNRQLPARLLCPPDSPGKNTGMGCHFLLQGIFLIQASNLGLLSALPWQAESLPLHHWEGKKVKSLSHVWLFATP